MRVSAPASPMGHALGQARMAKQALIEQRPWLLASIAAATAYYFLSDNPVFEGTWGLAAKGASVGVDGALLVVMLVLASAGDVAIELDFLTGGAFFAAAHVVAVGLYLRNLHKRPSPTQKLMGVSLLVATPLVSWLLSGEVQIAVYAGFLGAMASAAWMSHYPRYRVGTGAVLFVLSDWLIFSRMGPYDLAPLPDLLIWPLYYGGQLMIATGIVQCLRGEQPVR